MGIASETLFKPANSLPQASVLCLNDQGNVRLFDISWNDDNEEWWETRLLPSAVLFYTNKLLPRVLQERLLTAPTAVTPPRSAGKLAKSQPTPLRRHAEVPVSPGVPAAPSAKQLAFSPTLRPNKPVVHLKTSKVSLVAEVGPSGVYLKELDGTEPQRRKATKQEYIRAITSSEPVLPWLKGQRVVVNLGSQATADLIGKYGTVCCYSHDMCVVEIDDEYREIDGNLEPRQISIATTKLHVLDGTPSYTTVPVLNREKVRAADFWAWLQEYQKKNFVKLIGHTRQKYEYWLNASILKYKLNNQKLN